MPSSSVTKYAMLYNAIRGSGGVEYKHMNIDVSVLLCIHNSVLPQSTNIYVPSNLYGRMMPSLSLSFSLQPSPIHQPIIGAIWQSGDACKYILVDISFISLSRCAESTQYHQHHNVRDTGLHPEKDRT